MVKFSFFFRTFLRVIGSVRPVVVQFVAKTNLMTTVKRISLFSVVINASFNVRVFVLLSLFGCIYKHFFEINVEIVLIDMHI